MSKHPEHAPFFEQPVLLLEHKVKALHDIGSRVISRVAQSPPEGFFPHGALQEAVRKPPCGSLCGRFAKDHGEFERALQ